MKRFGIVLFALFSFSSLFAQANKDWDGIKPEVYPGSKAVVFSYTPFQSDLGGVPTTSLSLPPNINFLDIDLVGVGFKMFISNKFSLLASLAYGGSSETLEPTQPDPLIKEQLSTGYWSGIIAGNFHFASFYSITTYVGGSINLAVLAADYTINQTGGEVKYEFSSSSFGFGAHFGFDWFFTEGISLGGKYALVFTTSPKSELTTTSGGTSETEKGSSRTYFTTAVGTILLSVHF